MSINSILNTASLALNAQQLAIETAGNNISNASVTGYSRQRVDMQTNTPNQSPYSLVGAGSSPTDISRIRDTLLDGTYRDQSAQSGAYSTQSDLVGQISSMFNEPSDNGLAEQLDQFWNAWGDLANDPTNQAAKSVVQESGAAVASTLNGFSTQLDKMASDTRDTINTQVSTINNDLTQIAALNKQIVAAEAGGKSAPDLEDSRDNLLDQLSQMASIKTVDHSDGSTTVYIGTTTVVDNGAARQLAVQPNGNGVSISLQGQTTPIQNVGGSLGAMMSVLSNDIPNAHQQLDTLASQLVTTVNAVHQTGWTAAGDALGNANWDTTAPPTGSNVDFFDPTKTTAATISLSAQVASNASYIAAGDVQGGTGNNDIANTLSQFATNTNNILVNGSTTQTTSFSEYYRDLVTRVGVAASDANSSSTVYATLAQQADTRRTSVSGVSTDEELVSLTQAQQAYSAAAKVITTASAMAQTLLDMVGP